MAIERKFIKQNMKEFKIKQHIEVSLARVGLAGVKLRKTPLGDRIVLAASRPGLVVGRAGQNISRLTKELREGFSLENPQIEIEEVSQPDLDPNIIAERIINSLERFGSARFKGVGHKAMADVMNTGGALGVEIKISGKVPSTRAKSWRFYMGYLKKCGDIAIEGVRVAKKAAILKTGAIGVQVRILPSTVILPDHIKVLKDLTLQVETKNIGAGESRAIEAEAVATPVASATDAPVADAVAETTTEAVAEAPKKRKAPAKKKTAKSAEGAEQSEINPQ